MALIQSYAIWNNKGGVGKSTITFHLASRYAEQNPTKKVLVIDLCPQANSSMMLLGGGNTGEAHALNFCTQATPKTVVGYLSTVIAGGAGAPLPNPWDFIQQVSTLNPKITENLFLLCGDGNLEPMAPAISQAASAPALVPSMNPWVWVHTIFRNLINEISSSTDEWMIFVDTNPSFSIYTEIAVSSVNRLIAPVNADDSSRTAATAMFILLHGMNPPHPVYGQWTYAAQAQRHQMHVPQIHLIIGNRLTQYLGAAAAFGALSEATAQALFSGFQQHPTYFTQSSSTISSIVDFKQHYSLPLRDFNTAGVVSSHLGQRLSTMRQGYYPVHGTDVKINAEYVSDCLAAIDAVIARL